MQLLSRVLNSGWLTFLYAQEGRVSEKKAGECLRLLLLSPPTVGGALPLLLAPQDGQEGSKQDQVVSKSISMMGFLEDPPRVLSAEGLLATTLSALCVSFLFFDPIFCC